MSYSLITLNLHNVICFTLYLRDSQGLWVCQERLDQMVLVYLEQRYKIPKQNTKTVINETTK